VAGSTEKSRAHDTATSRSFILRRGKPLAASPRGSIRTAAPGAGPTNLDIGPLLGSRRHRKQWPLANPTIDIGE
jgi:hypothetical protein